ncbi:MAG: hypothetical protein ACRELA_21705 [Candidatus Rokuibacteriota bacterium]
MAFGLEVRGTPPGERQARTRALLDLVGLVLLSLLGLASTWGLRALEAYLVPWKEDVR